jgi:hypothetical protein
MGDLVDREQNPPPAADRGTGDKDQQDARRHVHRSSSSARDGVVRFGGGA